MCRCRVLSLQARPRRSNVLIRASRGAPCAAARALTLPAAALAASRQAASSAGRIELRRHPAAAQAAVACAGGCRAPRCSAITGLWHLTAVCVGLLCSCTSGAVNTVLSCQPAKRKLAALRWRLPLLASSQAWTALQHSCQMHACICTAGRLTYIVCARCGSSMQATSTRARPPQGSCHAAPASRCSARRWYSHSTMVLNASSLPWAPWYAAGGEPRGQRWASMSPARLRLRRSRPAGKAA